MVTIFIVLWLNPYIILLIKVKDFKFLQNEWTNIIVQFPNIYQTLSQQSKFLAMSYKTMEASHGPFICEKHQPLAL